MGYTSHDQPNLSVWLVNMLNPTLLTTFRDVVPAAARRWAMSGTAEIKQN